MRSVLGAMALLWRIGLALGGWIYDHFHADTWRYLASLAVDLGAAAIALASA